MRGLETNRSKLIFTVVFFLLFATISQATVTLTENNGTFDGNATASNFCDVTGCSNRTELLATFNRSYDHPSGDNTSVQINTAANDSHRIFNLLNMSGGLFLNADPATNLEAATKEYVDNAVASAGVTFFLTDSKSNISSYFNLSSTDTDEAESSIASSSLATGEQQVIFNYSTIISEPTFNTLAIGVYSLHYHAAKTSGTKDITISWELYNISPDGGVENLLMVSENASLPATKTSFSTHAVLTIEAELSAGDRLLLRISAHAASGGSNAIVTIYQEGGTDSNIQIRTTTAAFDDRFVNIGGDTMTGNLGLGSNSLLGTDMSIGYGNNTDYPPPCAGGTSISALADTPTCTSFVTGNTTTEIFSTCDNGTFMNIGEQTGNTTAEIFGTCDNRTFYKRTNPFGYLNASTGNTTAEIFSTCDNGTFMNIGEVTGNTTTEIQTAINGSQLTFEYAKMTGEFNISIFNITSEGGGLQDSISHNGTCWIFQAGATKLAVCE